MKYNQQPQTLDLRHLWIGLGALILLFTVVFMTRGESKEVQYARMRAAHRDASEREPVAKENADLQITAGLLGELSQKYRKMVRGDIGAGDWRAHVRQYMRFCEGTDREASLCRTIAFARMGRDGLRGIGPIQAFDNARGGIPL